jgi:Nuclease-related domain
MARMIPDHLRPDTKSNAEKLLYHAFQRQLPDGIVVFHHVPWQQPNLRRGARDGEADFVIADPRQGILIIEVKGGAVRYEGREGRWYSGVHAIDDPFEQAVTSKYSLLNFLKEQSFWRNRWITMGHAVSFPDAVVNQTWLRPDAPRTIVLDRTQVNDVHTWVRQLFQHWRGQEARDGAPEAAGVENLVSLLSPSIDFRPLLGTTIIDEAQELLRLSEKQFQLLDFLGRHRQAAITGCAGSGKTVLAVEKARRLSRQGFKVLLTCFNRNLAYFLQESLQDEQGLHVAHFHGLCSDLAHQAGLLCRENRPSGLPH